MPITLEGGKTGSVVRLEGDLDISCSEELKRVLLEAIASHKELQLDVAHTMDLDITAIQLLWAAAREAKKSGTSFLVVGEIPESVNGELREAGLESFLVSATCPPGTAIPVPVTTEGVDDRQV